MKKLILQWHITNKCNKRCKHCYQEKYSSDEFSISELIKIAENYIDFLQDYNKNNNQNVKGQINITGGEPFVRNDIWQLLEFFKENSKYFEFSILTNGSMLNESVVKKLKEYNPKMVQVSLDGDKKTHDNIRGAGSFNEVKRALKLLKKYKIKSLISFTANSSNYNQFGEVVDLGRKCGAYKVWTDRMVPIGSGNNSEIKTLSPKQVSEYVKIICEESNKLKNKISKMKITGERSLQFLNGISQCYKCTAGNNLIVLLENGDIMPCRRLPLVAGNIKKQSFKEIYYNSKIFLNLRNIKLPPKGCEKCKFLNICNGGAKCISYGIYGDYTIGDYGCILKKDNFKIDISKNI